METCLNAAFSKPKSGTVRVSIMSRESSWKMLERPLQAILIVAAHEQEAPAADDDEDDAAILSFFTESKARYSASASSSDSTK